MAKLHEHIGFWVLVGVIVWLIVLFGFYFFNSGFQRENTDNDSNACVELGCSDDTIYVGSINSDRYYECDCRFAQQVLPENIVCFSSDEEAVARDYVKSEC